MKFFSKKPRSFFVLTLLMLFCYSELCGMKRLSEIINKRKSGRFSFEMPKQDNQDPIWMFTRNIPLLTNHIEAFYTQFKEYKLNDFSVLEKELEKKACLLMTNLSVGECIVIPELKSIRESKNVSSFFDYKNIFFTEKNANDILFNSSESFKKGFAVRWHKNSTNWFDFKREYELEIKKNSFLPYKRFLVFNMLKGLKKLAKLLYSAGLILLVPESELGYKVLVASRNAWDKACEEKYISKKYFSYALDYYYPTAEEATIDLKQLDDTEDIFSSIAFIYYRSLSKKEKYMSMVDIEYILDNAAKKPEDISSSDNVTRTSVSSDNSDSKKKGGRPSSGNLKPENNCSFPKCNIL